MNHRNDRDELNLPQSENTSGTKPPVGFCRPPESTRFKKGVSGNPRGRPKGSLNVTTAFTKVLREKVVINEHGQRKTVTKLEAALKQLVNKAAGGDLRAIAQLRELAREAEVKQNTAIGLQKSELNEVDQDVMNGILKRFQSQNEAVFESTGQSDESEGGRHDNN